MEMRLESEIAAMCCERGVSEGSIGQLWYCRLWKRWLLLGVAKESWSYEVVVLMKGERDSG